MLQEVIQLEKARQAVEKVGYEIGSLSDYLDRGKPNPHQQQKTLAQIAAYQKQSEVLRAQLHDRLATLRASNPQVIEQWVLWHQGICQRILAEPAGPPHLGVRQHLAGTTLQAWEKVLRGEQDTVIINWYFLADYIKEVEGVVRQQEGRWWKFWQR